MLYILSLGLNNEQDLTLREIEILKKCDLVYFENYTSLMNMSLKNLEKLIKQKIIQADRELVENGEEILENAKKKDIAFLVQGDALSATTHMDLFLRAKKEKIEVKIIHNASILTAIGETGLMLYNFGKTTSIPFTDKNWPVEAPYTVLKNNISINLHTLCLLDLKPQEDRYMSTQEAIEFLLNLEKIKKEKVFTESTKCVICSALGTENQEIKYGTAQELRKIKLKKYPQCLIVPAKLHFVEEEILELYK